MTNQEFNTQEDIKELEKRYGKLCNELAIYRKKVVEIEDELFSIMHTLEEDFKKKMQKNLKPEKNGEIQK